MVPSGDAQVVWWDVGSGSIQLPKPCGVLCRFPEFAFATNDEP